MSVAETRNSGGETNRKALRAPTPPPSAPSSDGLKANHSRNGKLSRRTFTRSRSPAPQTLSINGMMPQQPPLPSPTSFLRPRSAGPAIFVLPGTFSVTLSSRMVPWHYQFRIDAKHAAEGAILMFALGWASQTLRSSSSSLLPSDDGLPIGTLTSSWSASYANHIHVRALCHHLCLRHLHGLESLFLHTNTPFIEYG